MFAILEQWREYGVTVHWLDEQFDTGDVVRVDRWSIDPDVETAASRRSGDSSYRSDRWTILQSR
jgi:methionyl-tRNA formyltransferase